MHGIPPILKQAIGNAHRTIGGSEPVVGATDPAAAQGPIQTTGGSRPGLFTADGLDAFGEPGARVRQTFQDIRQAVVPVTDAARQTVLQNNVDQLKASSAQKPDIPAPIEPYSPWKAIVCAATVGVVRALFYGSWLFLKSIVVGWDGVKHGVSSLCAPFSRRALDNFVLVTPQKPTSAANAPTLDLHGPDQAGSGPVKLTVTSLNGGLFPRFLAAFMMRFTSDSVDYRDSNQQSKSTKVPKNKMAAPHKRVDQFVDDLYRKHHGEDIICLQEIFSETACAKITARFSDYYVIHSVGSPISGLTSGVCGVSSGLMVLSKHKITHAEFHKFSNLRRSDALANKGFLSVDIEHPQLGSVRLYNTHLQGGAGRDEFGVALSGRLRDQQFSAIRQHLNKSQLAGEVIFAGDTNECFMDWEKAHGIGHGKSDDRRAADAKTIDKIKKPEKCLFTEMFHPDSIFPANLIPVKISTSPLWVLKLGEQEYRLQQNLRLDEPLRAQLRAAAAVRFLSAPHSETGYEEILMPIISSDDAVRAEVGFTSDIQKLRTLLEADWAECEDMTWNELCAPSLQPISTRHLELQKALSSCFVYKNRGVDPSAQEKAVALLHTAQTNRQVPLHSTLYFGTAVADMELMNRPDFTHHLSNDAKSYYEASYADITLQPGRAQLLEQTKALDLVAVRPRTAEGYVYDFRVFVGDGAGTDHRSVTNYMSIEKRTTV